jgi:hypothetical protein
MIGSGTQAKKENGSRWMNGGTKSEMVVSEMVVSEMMVSEMMRSWSEMVVSEMMRSWSEMMVSEMVMMMMMATPFSCLALD